MIGRSRYCVFSLLEAAGVGFRLDGQDAVPRVGIQAVLEAWSTLQHQHMSPGGIDVRGMQPFHDFSEGPDQWNLDDYKLHIEQMVKLKMNFIGLHTYPGQEPTVWTGTKDQFNPDTGNVTVSFPTTYMTTEVHCTARCTRAAAAAAAAAAAVAASNTVRTGRR